MASGSAPLRPSKGLCCPRVPIPSPSMKKRRSDRVFSIYHSRIQFGSATEPCCRIAARERNGIPLLPFKCCTSNLNPPFELFTHGCQKPECPEGLAQQRSPCLRAGF